MSRYRRIKEFHNTLNSKHTDPYQTNESEMSMQFTTFIFLFFLPLSKILHNSIEDGKIIWL